MLSPVALDWLIVQDCPSPVVLMQTLLFPLLGAAAT
jgi:hypothetical protein